MRLLFSKDLLAGVLFLVLGGGTLLIGRDYRMGTASEMGPGYFPFVLSVGLLLIGTILAVSAARDAGCQTVSGGSWRAVLLPPLAIVIFGLGLLTLGLVVSLILLLGTGVLASRETRWREVPFLMTAAIVFSVLVFIYGVGLPIPVWPQ